MKRLKSAMPLILYCLMISLFFLYPYWLSGSVNLEHDTLFHLSRIEGLARSIQEGNFLPRLYPYKNGGFGYGSPMFYSDVFLIVPALMMTAGMKVAVAYKFTLLAFTFFTALSMAFCLKKITRRFYAPYLGAFLYLFSNYRITDVYVRGALGEVMAFAFLPLILWGAFCLLRKETDAAKRLLTLAFSGLILTHNLSFLLGCLLFGGFLILNLKAIVFDRACFKAIAQAAVMVIGLTAFFIFPMLEQLLDHTMIVHYYGGSSSLSAYALCAWQFFINRTVFGLAGNSGDPASIMVTNPGWFLTFAPSLELVIQRKSLTTESRFLRQCLLLGALFLFGCSGLFPWDSLSFLSIVQFPWRLLSCATTLLCVPAAICLFDFFKRETLVFLAAISVSLANSVMLLQPVLSRTFVLSDQSDYSVILDGSLVDPYYSASWMRVELAAGDYLPWPTVDFRGYAPCVRFLDQTIAVCEVDQKSTTLFFELPERDQNEWMLAPLTWYKGYQAYQLNEAKEWEKIETALDSTTGLVRFLPQTTDLVQIKISYEKTTVQRLSELTTLATILALGMTKIRKIRFPRAIS